MTLPTVAEAMLVLLRVLSERKMPLSELRARYEPYAQSGEINLRVTSPHDVLESVAAGYPNVDRLDGLTVDLGDGTWFNLRPSNTEPVLRLNVEAHDDGAVAETVAAVRALVETAS